MPDSDVVLVTGSSGFIGAPFIRALASSRAMVGFDRAGDPHPPVEAECVCVDLTDADSVQAGLARVRYTYGDRLASMVHLAAYYDWRRAVEGLAVFVGTPPLRLLATVQLLAALSAGASSALLIVLATDHLGVGPDGFGVMQGGIGRTPAR